MTATVDGDEGDALSSGSAQAPVIKKEDDGYAYILVKVTSEQGREYLLGMREVMVEKEFILNNVSFFAIRVLNGDLDFVSEQFMASPDVESFEEDSLFTEAGTLDAYLTDDEVRQLMRHNNGRSLEEDEILPYGISMVQGDQVDVGPDPVSVCIIDTGVALGHEDLDSALFTGTNRISSIGQTTLQWARDTRGHGTHVSKDYGIGTSRADRQTNSTLD